MMSVGRDALREFWASKVSKMGVALLVLLVVVSVYVVLTYPLDFGLRYWNNPAYWADNPKAVPPEWWNLFTDKKLPPHVIKDFHEPSDVRDQRGRRILEYVYSFDFQYDEFPSFLSISLNNVTFSSRRPPRVEIFLDRPDNISVRLLRFTVTGPRPGEEAPYFRYVEAPNRVRITGDKNVFSALSAMLKKYYGLSIRPSEVGEIGAEKVAFGEPSGDGFKVLRGRYVLRAVVTGYDEDVDVGMLRMVVGGRVYGFSGTDTLGRDLAVGLLFGFPIALLIGFLTSTVTTIIGAITGVISGYMGGKVDTGIQRLSDIILNIPLLPILIFFTFVLGTEIPRLWVIIAILIAFSWPSLTIVVRPMVLQIRESQFVEAAVAIGAPRLWIMFRHIFPQVAPFVFAQLIFFTPSAILAEAALSFLGLGDPSMPTWGQILETGFRSGGVYIGYWWWVLPPGLLIVFAAITFVLIALGLEPVVNPRLRRMK